MTENWKQFLTEKVLNGCWHERVQVGDILNMRSECSCGKPDYLGTANDHINHTFNNRDDLLYLYEAIYEDGKWEPLYEYLRNNYLMGKGTDECISSGLKAWLICLNGEGYEDRCKMVAEFYGYKE